MSFSEELEDWLGGDGPKTLGALGEVFGERSFAVAMVILMFVPALPLPTGGVTHLFEAIAVVLAAQMLMGRDMMWVPARWRSHELGGVSMRRVLPTMVRRIRWFERFARPRGARFFDHPWGKRLLGVAFVALAASAAFAPPFSGLDTLPALGAVVIALSMLFKDAVVLAIGVAIGTGGVALIVTIGSALVAGVRHLVSG